MFVFGFLTILTQGTDSLPSAHPSHVISDRTAGLCENFCIQNCMELTHHSVAVVSVLRGSLSYIQSSKPLCLHSQKWECVQDMYAQLVVPLQFIGVILKRTSDMCTLLSIWICVAQVDVTSACPACLFGQTFLLTPEQSNVQECTPLKIQHRKSSFSSSINCSC
jgi:hypothetical protein